MCIRDRQKSAGISSLINIAIGLVIGLAVMYFLVVPAAVSNANNEAQKTITDIGNQLDTKTSRIQELETQMGTFPRDRMIVCCCQRGSSSLMACRKLSEAGFRAVNAAGGLMAYRGNHLVS
mgnify:CR=1 FL=1